MKLKNISNIYTEERKAHELRLGILGQKIKESAERIKQNNTQLQLGDDSKVDEAVMITFLASMFEDMPTAYNTFMQLRAEKAHAANEKRIQNLEDFIKAKENIDKYTALDIFPFLFLI